MIKGNNLTVTLTDEQIKRFGALNDAGDLTPNEQIGAMIDLDYEEWQDALETKQTGVEPRSTRWARFVKSEAN